MASLIKETPELANTVGEVIWHYLIDIDIRLKDHDYKLKQLAGLRDEIRRLSG